MRRLLSLLLLGAFGGLFAACDVGSRDCQLPADCFGGEVCVRGQCEPAQPVADAVGADASDADSGLDSGCAGTECPPCESGFHLCGDRCVDDTSTNSCGSRCEPCPPGGAGFEAICEPGGTCGLSCVGEACASCQDNNDCTDTLDKTVCEGGTCVECSAASRAACGPNSCDPLTHTCTDTPVGSRRDCQSCAADNECREELSRCVPMNFKGEALPERYCLPLKSGACNSPLPVPVTRTASSETAPKQYCAPNEGNTTCEAILGQDRQCSQNSACGRQGYADGLCKWDRCTYPCDARDECFVGDSCIADMYCG